MWDPGQYRHFADERSRPFHDLLARVPAEEPAQVADLGCGPGELTATLARRWPGATVTGVDSSPAMIEAAQATAAQATAAQATAAQATAAQATAAARAPAAHDRLSFELADVTRWQPAAPLDVLVANAVLQWLPGQLGVLTRWAGLLAPGGWLAVQLPGNFDQPGHVAIRELAATPRWQRWLAGVELNRQAEDPGAYLDALIAAGCEADVWETTYLHVLPGEDPVLEWYRGTGLRPVIDALPAAEATQFLAAFGDRMRAAYPARRYGTVLPFRRVFMVAQRG